MAMITATTLKARSPLLAEILDGAHDDLLEDIGHALVIRKKMRFQKGAKVRLVGTKSVELDGQIATILKVNAKSISVGVGEPTTDQWGTSWSLGEYNVPPRMLEPVA